MLKIFFLKKICDFIYFDEIYFLFYMMFVVLLLLILVFFNYYLDVSKLIC